MVFGAILLTATEELEVLESVGYDRDQLEKDLVIFRDWIAQQLHFPSSKLKENNDFLTNFLVGSKSSIERAKRKLDNYYSWRRKSALFSDRDPTSSDFLNNYKNVCDRAGFERHNILLSDDTSSSANKEENEGISAGDCCVVDCSDFHSGYLPGLNPAVLRDMLHFVQDALPNRCSQYYFINCSPLVETVFNKLIKPLLSKKMTERFTVTREGASYLLRIFPRDVLPSDYGGDGSTVNQLQDKTLAPFRKLVFEVDGFLSDLRELTDETKRPKDSEPDSEQSIFGVHGTIRTLTVD